MIVIDASVAVKWVIPEDDSGPAFALQNEELCAPSLWLVEAANALWRLAVNKTITARDAEASLQKLRAAPVKTIPLENDMDAALEWSIRLRHPIYDCVYLAMALRESTYVVTADSRFLSAVARDRQSKAQVRLLGA